MTQHELFPQVPAGLEAMTPGTQLHAVLSLMRDGHWRTLWQIREALWATYSVRASEAGVSARLRDLRKLEYGSHTVERRQLKKGTAAQAYRVRVNLAHATVATV